MLMAILLLLLDKRYHITLAEGPGSLPRPIAIAAKIFIESFAAHPI
jgi:hypothetical protein